MGLSKLLDPAVPNIRKKNIEGGCMLGSTDCMFLDNNGDCAAEWCIFSELPKVINTTRTVTCSICGGHPKLVSIYSGIREYICPTCKQKIREKIYGE